MLRSALLLGNEPEAELEGGVERLLDALDTLAHRGDLLALPDRDQRNVLGLSVLNDAKGIGALGLIGLGDLLVQSAVDVLVRVPVLEEATVAHERREVVV